MQTAETKLKIYRRKKAALLSGGAPYYWACRSARLLATNGNPAARWKHDTRIMRSRAQSAYEIRELRAGKRFLADIIRSDPQAALNARLRTELDEAKSLLDLVERTRNRYAREMVDLVEKLAKRDAEWK